MKVAVVYPNEDRMVNRGVGFIAAVAAEDGHVVRLYDTAYLSTEDVATQVAAEMTDVVLMTSTSPMYATAKDAARKIKERTNVPIVLGGIHATVMGGQVLDDCSDVDYLCVGEGEEFTRELLGQMPGGDVTAIRNLVYRGNDGRPVANSVRPATDLASLPPFDYRYFRQESIVRSGPKPGFTYVFATRGCPYRCTYCCNGSYLDLYGKSYLRKHPVERIIAELRLLRDQHGAKFFYFGDEMIMFDREYVTELFCRVREEIGLPFGCMLRVETVDDGAVDLFRRTGCCYVSVGVECADEMFRREWLNRRMTNEQIYSAFRLLRTVPNMFIYAFFMHGFPVDYDDRLTAETAEMRNRLAPDLIQDTVFYPLPGTKLHEYCVTHDLIDSQKAATVKNYLRESILKGGAV